MYWSNLKSEIRFLEFGRLSLTRRCLALTIQNKTFRQPCSPTAFRRRLLLGPNPTPEN